MAIQSRKRAASSVPPAAAGKVTLFCDLDGKFKFKDEFGNVIDGYGLPGINGYNGWSFPLANVVDGERVVQQIIDAYGGSGTQPTELIGKFIGPSGPVTAIADATNIRGSSAAAPAMTNSEVLEGTSTTPKVPTAAQLKLAAETFGGTNVTLSPAADNGLTEVGNDLLVSKNAIGDYLGVPSFETLVYPENPAVPVLDVGYSSILFKNRFFRRVQRLNAQREFAYLVQRGFTQNIENVNLTGVASSSTTRKTVGNLMPPADTLRLSGKTKISITITGDNPLKNCKLAMGFSDLVKTAQIVEKATDGTYTGNTLTMELYVEATHATILACSQVDPATAPTTWASESKAVDINTLANINFPVFVSFASIQNSPLITITSVSASIQINSVPRYKQLAGKSYREAYLQPHPKEDHVNRPLSTTAVSKNMVYIGHDPSTTTSTVHAVGTAGSDTITGIYSTAGIEPGMIAYFSDWVTRAYTVDGAPYGTPSMSARLTTGVTLSRLGYHNRVKAVTATTIQFEKPMLQSFTLSGVSGTISNGAVPSIAFTHNWKDISIKILDTAYSEKVTFATARIMSGSDTQAKAYSDGFPVYKTTDSDPITEIRAGYVVSPNGWIYPFGASDVTNFGERFTCKFFIRFPAGLNQAAITTRGNSDRNVVVISEDGRYALEMIYVNFNTGYISCTRATITDLYGNSAPYILNRPEKRLVGYTAGNRAWGGGNIPGIVRIHEVDAIPDYSQTTGETLQQITDRVNACKTAIPHAVPMLCASLQMKAKVYCPDFSVQATTANFFSFISQFEADKPTLKGSMSGYAIGDVIYGNDGVFADPIKITVTAVNSGVPTDWFVSSTGQYMTRPTDCSAISTKTSGSGTGAIIDCLNIPGNTLITTADLAFPVLNIQNVFAYPATIIDGGGLTNGYNGTIAMGDYFTIDPNYDIAADFIARRQADPLNYSNSYEFCAYLFAIQRYGIYVVDTASGNNLNMIGESGINGTRWGLMAGITGSGIRKNCQALKWMLRNVENITPVAKTPGGTLLGPEPLDLYPLNN